MFSRKLEIEQLEERCTPSGFPGKGVLVTIDPDPKEKGFATQVILPAQAAAQVLEHNPNAFAVKVPVKDEPKPGDQKEIFISITPPSQESPATTVSLPAHAGLEVLEHNPNASFGKPTK